MRTSVLNKMAAPAKNTSARKASDVDKWVSDRLAGCEKELQDIDSKIEEYRVIIARANAALADPATAMDPAAYTKAREDRGAAKDAIDMLERRKEILGEEPVITKTEYEQACSDLFAEFDAYHRETAEKLYQLSNEMADVTAAYKEAAARIDAILAKVQGQAYKYNDVPLTGGVYMGTAKVDTEPAPQYTPLVRAVSLLDMKTCNTGGMVIWGERARSCQQYKDYARIRESGETLCSNKEYLFPDIS